jgi:hypothetical protein
MSQFNAKLGLSVGTGAGIMSIIDAQGNITAPRVGIGTPLGARYTLDVKGTTPNHVINTDMGLNFNQVPNPVTATLVQVVTGTGNLSNGTYYYNLTFISLNGETNCQRLGPITVDASHKQVLINLPISEDYRVTGRKLYRSVVNGNYWTTYLLTTISDNTTTTYQDNIADGSLGAYGGFWQINTTSNMITINENKALVIDINGTHLGYQAGANLSTGGGNTYIGVQAGYYTNSGTSNVGLGYQAGLAISSGSANIAIGYQSMNNYGSSGVTGSHNIAMGWDTAGNMLTSSVGNIGIGSYSFNNGTPTVMNYSTALGYYAGATAYGSYCTFLGNGAGQYETSQNGTLIIDSLDRSNQANSRNYALIYGVINATPASQILSLGGGGNVGIGTITPGYALDVKGTATTSFINTDNGYVLTPVIKPASCSAALILASGNLGSGAYYYAVTFTTANGETGYFASGSITTDGTHQQVTVTIPTSSDYRVTGRKIYRSKVGNVLGYFYLLTTIADNTTTTYVDNIADGSLGAQNPYSAGAHNSTSSIYSGANRVASFSDTSGTMYMDGNLVFPIGTGIGVGQAYTKTSAVTEGITLSGYNLTTPYPQLRINMVATGSAGIGMVSTSLPILQLGYCESSLWVASSTMTINIQPTTASTSTTTGALTVAGGVGIAGRVSLGGSQGIEILSGAPGTVANTLYSVSGTLYFNGTAIVGGTGLTNPMTTLGDFIYGGASGVGTRLAGVTVAKMNVLTQTGTGSASQAPVWSTTLSLSSITDTSIGSQMISATNNSTFTSAGNWVYGTGWSLGSGNMAHTTGNATSATLDNTYLSSAPVASNYYLIVFDVNTTTSGTLTVGIGSQSTTCIMNSGYGLITGYTVNIQASGTGVLTFTADSSWAGTIDNVIVKQVTVSTPALILYTNSGVDSNYFYTQSINSNSSMGYKSMLCNTTGFQNAAIGYQALNYNTTGSYNMAIGAYALQHNTTGLANVAVGASALTGNITGHDNVAIGNSALFTSSMASLNTAIGSSVLSNVTIGEENTSIGYESGASLTLGDCNTFIGNQTGQNTVVQSHCLFIGYHAGRYENTTDGIVLLDTFDRGTLSNGRSQALIYGLSSSTNTSQILCLGGGGNVGIGTISPGYNLDVQGTTNLDGINTQVGLNFNPVSTPTSLSAVVLTAAGNLGIGNYNYLISFYTALGETNIYDNGVTYTTTSGHQQIQLTIPVSSDYRVIGRKIYRTPVNPAGSWVATLCATIADNTTTTYTDNASDASIASNTVGYFLLNTTTQYITVNGAKAVVLDPLGTYIGYAAGHNVTSAGRNVLIGEYAGYNVTTGPSNVAVGDNAMAYCNTGSSNTAMGYNAGAAIKTGSLNVAVGYDAYWDGGLGGITGGDQNTAVGALALFNNTGAVLYNNTAVGYYTGVTATGQNNIFLGFYAGCYEDSTSYQIIIDNQDRTTKALQRTNSLIYGVTNTTNTSQTLQLGGGGAVITNGPNGQQITQSSHGFVVGNILMYNGTTYVKATYGIYNVCGIVTFVIDTNNFVLSTEGVIRGLSGLTAGSTYYLSSSTAGALVTPAPNPSGYSCIPVLIATSTTTGIVTIAGDFAGNDSPAFTGGVQLIAGTPTITANALYAVGTTLYWNGSVFTGSGMSNPMTTIGDIIYASNTASPATPTRLGSPTVAGLYTLIWNPAGSAVAPTISSIGTGTGGPVFATSPSLTTPTLGVASATTINKVTITAPTTSATLTLIQGSTLATNAAYTYTLTSAGNSTVTFPNSTSATMCYYTSAPAAQYNLAYAGGTSGLISYLANTAYGTLVAASTGAPQWVTPAQGVLYQASATTVPVMSMSPSLTLPVCGTGITLSTHAATTTNGTVWYDSTRNLISSYCNGLTGYHPRLIFSQYSTVTVASSASLTNLLTGSAVGTATLPASYITIGKQFRIRAGGYYGTYSTNPTIIFTVEFGSTVLAVSGSLATTASLTTQTWEAEVIINAYSATSCWTTGHVRLSTSTTAGTSVNSISSGSTVATPAAVTVGTTSQSLSLNVTWSSSNSANTISCTYATIEELC